MIKYLVVHGHFYQPERRDPFTGEIPREFGAEPFSNFNEKINFECYKPNVDLGNFNRISFDLGPTLGEWIKEKDAETFQKIISSDDAIAQPFHHTILPLSRTIEDLEIQVYWGIEYYKTIFHKDPKGMWLPECAVNNLTLEVLIDSGIKYTLLPAHINLDITKPYKVRIKENKEITIFFFDNNLTKKVSFDDWCTINADNFIKNEIEKRLHPEIKDSQIMLIVNDGETFGHHKKFRDKFLEYLTTLAATNNNLKVCSLNGLFNESIKLRHTNIIENTTWSCDHGLNRWISGCECTGLNQEWKAYFRNALSAVAKRIDDIFFDESILYFYDPINALKDYINVKLKNITTEEFLERNSKEYDIKALSLMEAQYFKHQSFSSCGFFFDDISRIESINNIKASLKAIDIINKNFDKNLIGYLIKNLENIKDSKGKKATDIIFDLLIQ